jgi:hypothetical protein
MAIKINPATGKIIAKRFSLRRLERIIEGDNNVGFCIACGAEKDCVEPDARKYPCPVCEHNTVYGAEELVMMGMVKGAGLE